jgi:hypothetical protein
MTSETRTQPLPFVQRLVTALPDVMASGIFLYAWIAPLHWRETRVADLMLVMLMEFVLVNSAPFIGGVVMSSGVPSVKRYRALAGFAAFYGLFIGSCALTFRVWWPVMALAWLFAAKLASMFVGRQQSEREKQRMTGYWGVSVGFFLLALSVTLFLPVPEFGITMHGAAYGIPGRGEWVSHPHVLIAAGFLYFGLLAATRLTEQPTWWRTIKVKG